MFEENSYVERPPLTLRGDHRLCLEAIAFCMRTIMAALEAIQQVANRMEPKVSPTSAERLSLYTYSWVVIDQTHMLRSLLAYFNPKQSPGPLYDFWQKYEVCTNIRN